MADGPDLALQKTLVATLRGAAGVTALVGARVYDRPPQDVQFPYVQIGQIELAPLRMDGGTDHDLTFAVEAYSRPAGGRVEAARVAQAVRVALDSVTLTIAGFHCDWCHYVTQAASRAPDGESYVSVVAFQAALSNA